MGYRMRPDISAEATRVLLAEFRPSPEFQEILKACRAALPPVPEFNVADTRDSARTESSIEQWKFRSAERKGALEVLDFLAGGKAKPKE